MGGGDLIHAQDLVSTYHTSPDAVHDATFIKVRHNATNLQFTHPISLQFTLEVDKTAAICQWSCNRNRFSDKYENLSCSLYPWNSQLDGTQDWRNGPNLPENGLFFSPPLQGSNSLGKIPRVWYISTRSPQIWDLYLRSLTLRLLTAWRGVFRMANDEHASSSLRLQPNSGLCRRKAES